MANTKSAAIKSRATSDSDGDVGDAATAVAPVRLAGDSLADRLAPYMKQIAIGAALLVLVIVAVVVVRWRQHVRQETQTAAYVKALAILDQGIANPDDPRPNPGAFATRKARAEAALAALGATAVDSAEGKLIIAGLYFDARQLDKAQAAFQALSNGSGTTAYNAKEALGFVAEARAEEVTDAAQKQAHLEQALASFKTAATGETGALEAQALYHQGRILHQLGRLPEAQATLQQALLSSPTQIAKTLIETRLGLVASELP